MRPALFAVLRMPTWPLSARLRHRPGRLARTSDRSHEPLCDGRFWPLCAGGRGDPAEEARAARRTAGKSPARVLSCHVCGACCMSHVLATVCPVRECYSWNVCTGCLQRAIETQQREAQRQQLRALMAQKAEEEAAKRRRAEADARAVEAQAEVKRQAELEEAKRHAAAAAVRWQTRAAHCARHVACCVWRVAYRTA